MKRIAIVEDNPDNRLFVEALLMDVYDVSAYESGAAALAGWQASVPDLVLLDISLPEMSGSEVLAKIRHDPKLRSLPVIALTAHAMVGDREKYLAEGFDDYVSKPIVDENDLLSPVARLLE